MRNHKKHTVNLPVFICHFFNHKDSSCIFFQKILLMKTCYRMIILACQLPANSSRKVVFVYFHLSHGHSVLLFCFPTKSMDKILLSKQDLLTHFQFLLILYRSRCARCAFSIRCIRNGHTLISREILRHVLIIQVHIVTTRKIRTAFGDILYTNTLSFKNINMRNELLSYQHIYIYFEKEQHELIQRFIEVI